MSRVGQNIYKRKDGRWEGRYIVAYDENGKSKYKSAYAKSYSALKEKLSLRMYSDNTVSNVALDVKKSKYGYWLNEWLKSKKAEVKYSTFIRYKNSVENHLLPELGEYKIERISIELIKTFFSRLEINGRIDKKGGLAPKTRSDILTIIKESFSYASKHGVNIACNLDEIVIKKEQTEIQVLSPSEQVRLLKILTKDTDLCKLGVLICFFTGIRIGELCALQWKNISLEDKTLKVEYTLQRIQNDDKNSLCKTQIIITKPKSFSSVRTIPLSDTLVEIIKKFRNSPNVFLLTGMSKKHMEPRTLHNHFKKYLEEAHIQDTKFHNIRHTFATNCIEVGFDVKTLSEILGHSSVKITLDRYVHSSMDLKRKNIEKLTLLNNYKPSNL